jgi:putative endonuclease
MESSHSGLVSPFGRTPVGCRRLVVFTYMHYVYLLKSRQSKWVYVGCSDDLKRRFFEHNTGQVVSTKPYMPLDLVYYESYTQKHHATKREYELKHNSQQKEILLRRLEM